MDDFYSFFKKLTYKDGLALEPYTFQVDAAREFEKGRNFIIQAPTGSGKTWAAIAPFIYFWYKWRKGKQLAADYPRKLIYSLPLRTLANSLYEEVKTKLYRNLPELDIKVTIQTGERPCDVFFDGDIIFTTIDQTLSNILGIPLSLPSKLSNINAGAVLSSFLVFDEFHLLEPKRSLDTVISLLRIMREITPFCLMTATLSNDFLRLCSHYLDAEIIRVGKNDYQQFGFVKRGAKKTVIAINDIIQVERIIEKHQKKSIVICNTVDRCVDLYKDLKKQVSPEIELICIHSRFFQRDRKEKEEKITRLFGKDSNANVILVSTQVIEVGLDISCDVMHTEISPVNSFLQRIGRCCRWGGEGEVLVYEVPDNKNKYLPYDEKLCISTFQELSKVDIENIDYHLAQKLIHKVLGEFESKVFSEIKNNSANKWDQIRECWMIGGKDKARTLIRDIRSISIVLLPEGLPVESLYYYESLSMNPFSLISKIRKITERMDVIPNYTLKHEESSFIDFDEEKKLASIDFEKIKNENIIALNSDIVGYSPEFGLDFECCNRKRSETIGAGKKFQYALKKDTYEEHIKWMLEIYDEELKEIFAYPFKKIQNQKYSSFEFDAILRFILIMHDYGKLDQQWQGIMNHYQSQKEKSGQSIFLAHTDYDPNSEHDRELMEKTYQAFKVGRKPPHAGVGAFVSFRILPYILKLDKKNKDDISFIRIVLSTIIRHHAAYTSNFSSYNISDEGLNFVNKKLIKKLIPQFDLNIVPDVSLKQSKGDDLKSYIIQFNQPIEAFLYFLFIRILRLCDQFSFRKNPLYEQEDFHESILCPERN